MITTARFLPTKINNTNGRMIPRTIASQNMRVGKDQIGSSQIVEVASVQHGSQLKNVEEQEHWQ